MTLSDLINQAMESHPTTLSGENGEYHPIVEAAVVSLTRQISENTLRNLLSKAKDEQCMREIIMADGFLATLKDQKQKNEILSLLQRNMPMEQIIKPAAMYFSENTRIDKGDVLVNMAELSSQEKKYAYRLLRKTLSDKPRSVYLPVSELNNVKEKIAHLEETKHKRYWARALAISSLILAGLYATYYFHTNYQIEKRPDVVAVE